MKTPALNLFSAALASLLALTVAAWAQDQNPPAPPPPAAAASDSSTAPGAPATTEDAPAPASKADEAPAASAPAATDASSAPDVTPTATAAAPEATTTEPATSELRRLDTPPTAEEPAKSEPAPVAAEAPAAPEAPAAAPAEPAPATRSHVHRRHPSGNARVAVWHDSSLGEGEQADAVVSIFGSSTSAGDVGDAVVSVFGSSTSSGDVGNAVVSVFGTTTVSAGRVGDAAVAVFGNNKINATIRGNVVAVFGNVELGPKAEVSGDIVCVGGRVIRQPGAVTHGEVNNVQLGFDFGDFAWLHAWVRHCLVLGRPLAFAANLGWAWGIALGFLVLYLVLALLFPRGITKCAETLEQRPGYSILTAFLVTLLTPAAAILLLITVIGTPALMVGLLVAGLFGKAAMFAWMGRRITLRFGEGPLAHPVFAVLIGGVIALLLYTVPFLGFLVSKLLSWIGLGVAVYTLIQASKRAKPARVAPVAALAATPVVATASPAGAALIGGVVPPVPASGEAAAGVAAAEPPLTAAPMIMSAVALPRAGFWIRVAASLLDLLVIGIATHLLLDRLPDWAQPHFLVLVAAYSFVFWALRATTLGGIVCGLKVVRLDDRPVDWVTSLVRALGGFLSFFAAGVGFIWVAFDDQKQSWHDKIAGTTIVRVPRGVSLI